MRLAGIYKNSFVDYPGLIAAVVFTRGCNMDCWYCHNRHIIGDGGENADENHILKFLESRKGFLDGVVLTGGEPLLQEDAPAFLLRLKQTGLSVKLDTNGMEPDVLKTVIQAGLVDYTAMDIKAPYEKYAMITPVFDLNAIRESVSVIMGSGLDYEFRTTFAPNLDAADIGMIAKEIAGAKKYCIQQYKKSEGMRANIAPEPHSLSDIKAAVKEAEKYISSVQTRGV